MNIRYAKESDFDLLIEGLENTRIIEKWPEFSIKATVDDIKEYKRAIEDKLVRVIEENNEALGFLYFRTDFSVMHIREKFFWVNLIYIKEDKRRKGFGTKLQADALRIAKEKGFSKIMLDVFKVNDESLEFHKELGFNPIYTIYEKNI